MYRSAIEKLKKEEMEGQLFPQAVNNRRCSPGWQDMADEGIRQGVL